MLGDGADDYFAALDQPPTRALRLNRVKLGDAVPTMADVSLTPAPFGHGIYYFDGVAGGKNPLHHAGAYYIQEPSASLPVLSAPIKEGDTVLDLCASPGGKTGQLAEAVGESGFVLSNEYSRKRALTLLGNVERMGYRNCAVTNASPDELCALYAGVFDVVLVDAPCSGEGMFRREPEAVAAWSSASVAGCAARQRDILECAAIAVADGGYLVYSTCTLSLEEDEENVAAFLASHSEFEQVMPSVPDGVCGLSCGIDTAGMDASMCRRAYPHLFDGEGQFFAMFRRIPGTARPLSVHAPRAKKPRHESGGIEPLAGERLCTVRRFFDSFSSLDIDRTPIIFKDSVYLLPTAAPQLSVAGMIAPGVRVGTIERDGRLTPHHQFFSAFGSTAKLRLMLDPNDARAAKYLHGDAMSADEAEIFSDVSTWGAVLIGGCAVGGIRIAGESIKNHYPKGLRI